MFTDLKTEKHEVLNRYHKYWNVIISRMPLVPRPQASVYHSDNLIFTWRSGNSGLKLAIEKTGDVKAEFWSETEEETKIVFHTWRQLNSCPEIVFDYLKQLYPLI